MSEFLLDRPSGPVFLKDILGFSLFAIVALGAGLGVNALSPKPLALVYQPPAEKLAAAMGSGTTSIGIVAIDKVREMTARADVIVLDARPRDFYDLGHIPGARSLSKENFDDDYKSLEHELKSPGKTLVVYCSDSGCEDSEFVAKKLEEMGFERVVLYIGGYQEWEEAGFPTEGEQ